MGFVGMKERRWLESHSPPFVSQPHAHPDAEARLWFAEIARPEVLTLDSDFRPDIGRIAQRTAPLAGDASDQRHEAPVGIVLGLDVTGQDRDEATLVRQFESRCLPAIQRIR